MTERFRMPMTWEIDRARAFVGGSVYHSCLGTRGFPAKKAGLNEPETHSDVILTILCVRVCSSARASECATLSPERARVSAQKLPGVSVAMMPYGVIVSTAFALRAVPLEPGAEE